MLELFYLENGVLAMHRLKDFTFNPRISEERVTRARYSKKAAKQALDGLNKEGSSSGFDNSGNLSLVKSNEDETSTTERVKRKYKPRKKKTLDQPADDLADDLTQPD